MDFRRRKFLHLAAVALTLPFTWRRVWAQAYPTRPVRIIVGFPAGVAPDIVARVIGQALSERLGQQFVIEMVRRRQQYRHRNRRSGAARRLHAPSCRIVRCDVAFVPITSVIEYIRDGRLRPLAVTTAKRAELLPDVPALSEILSGYDATGWNGIGAPKGTPSAIIEKLNNEINAIVLNPTMKARLIGLGVEPLSMTSAEFGKRIADDTEKWAKVIKFANIKAE